MGDLTRQTLAASTGLAQLGAGSFFKLIEAQYAVDLVFSYGGATKRIANIEAGYELRTADPFDSVAIYNTAASANAIGVFVGEETEDYARLAALVELRRASVLFNATDVPLVNGVANQVVVANPLNRRVILKVPNAAANPARVGATNVVANNGVEVAPGQFLILETTASVFACGAGGASSISYTVERYPG